MKQASGVILIDRDRDEVLLLQRPDGSWGIAGGKQEEGEMPIEAACRETMEETGLKLTPDMLTPVRSIQNDDGFLFSCYKAVVDKFEPVMADGEHLAWGWFPLSALPSPLFGATEEIILGTPMAAMDKAVTDGNGWKEYRDNPISKVGVFPYLGKDIPGAPKADEIYAVYRPAEELQKDATIESFRLLPWIAGHTMLGKAGAPAEKVGVSGVIGESVYFEGDTLYGNLKVFSNEHAALIKGGVKDLSLGYLCNYEHSPGVFEGEPYEYIQRNIRGNHVATVDDGRMGPEVAVCDSTFKLEKETMTKEAEAKDNSPVDLSKLSKDELKALAEAVGEKLKASAGDEEPDNKDKKPAATDEDKDKKPAGDEDPDNKEKKPAGDEDKDKKPAATDEDDEDAKEAKAEDSAIRVMRVIARRDALAKSLTASVGVFDHSDMTLGEVAKYGLKQLGLTAAKGQEVAMLEGFVAAQKRAPHVSMRSPATAAAMDSATGDVPSFLSGHV